MVCVVNILWCTDDLHTQRLDQMGANPDGEKNGANDEDKVVVGIWMVLLYQ